MQPAMALTALLAAMPLSLVLATDVIDGAHDPRPQLSRPNICDDKCDVSFLAIYDACKDIKPDCVKYARQLTCERDYACSMNCGYTAEGCINPHSWTASVDSVLAVTSTSCSSTTTSTMTEVVTIPRPSLTIADIDKVEAVFPVRQFAEEPAQTGDSIHPAIGISADVFTVNSASLGASPTLALLSSPDNNTIAPFSILPDPTTPPVSTDWNTTTSITVSTTIIDSVVTKTSTTGSGNATTMASHALGTPKFTHSVPESTHTTAGAVTQTPALALLGGLAIAAFL